MRKKASLNLSVNAIVVIVIAFVVMGLALTLTNIIFKGGESKLGEAFEVIELGKEATAQNPITIPENINLQRNKRFTLDFQFYNRNEIIARNVSMDITACTNSDDGSVVTVANLPVMVSSSAPEIGPSDVYQFKASITSKTLTSGLYICTVQASNEDTVFDQKDVFINIAT